MTNSTNSGSGNLGNGVNLTDLNVFKLSFSDPMDLKGLKAWHYVLSNYYKQLPPEIKNNPSVNKFLSIATPLFDIAYTGSSFYKNHQSFTTLGSTFNEYYNQLSPDIKNNPYLNGFLNSYQSNLAVNPLTMSKYMMERMFIEAPAGIFGSNSIVNFKGNNPLDLVLFLSNYPAYIHYYGYDSLNLDPNAKWWIDALTGIDQDGNMSTSNFILNLATLLPWGGWTARGLKLLGFTPKFLQGSKALNFLLNSKTLQPLFKGLGKKWETFKDLVKNPILNKFPISRDTLQKAWKYAVDAADLIMLKPSTIVKYLKNTPVGKWISQKLGNYASPMTKYYADFVKAAHDGPSELLKFGLEMFTKGSPTAIKNLVNSSNFKKYLQPLTKIADSPLYKSVQTTTKTTIKRFLEISGVYDAAKKVNEGYQQIKNSEYVKTASKIIDKIKQESQQVKKQGVVNYVKTKVKKHKKTIYKYAQIAYKYIKPSYDRYVKPIVNTAVSIYKSASNAWNGFKSWLGFKGPADHSSSSFKSRASGFTYQGYTGSRKSISQTIESMSGNCVDGTLAQVALASSFGIPAEIVKTTWNGNPHVYGRINGVDRDIANHALTGSWGRPPAGPGDSNGNVILQKGAIVIESPEYDVTDLEKKIEKVTLKVLDRESTFY